jgi:uncharacterized membrane protein YqjE
MAADNNQSPGVVTLVGRLARTFIGAAQNRFELLSVEWQEERMRMTELMIWTVALLFFGMLAVVLLTGTIILLFREDLRVYVAAGFTVIYLIAAIVAWVALKSRLSKEPFEESIDQARKDQTWLKSFH